MLQYFSKLHKKWIDFKWYDCEKTLKKYGYKIREKPVTDCSYSDPENMIGIDEPNLKEGE